MTASDQMPPRRRVLYGTIALLVVMLLTCGIGIVGLISDASDPNFISQDAAVLADEDPSEVESIEKLGGGKERLAGIDAAGRLGLALDAKPSIRASGQIAFAIPNGGIPRSSHPTGPPAPRV